jgi:hypothetical protein
MQARVMKKAVAALLLFLIVTLAYSVLTPDQPTGFTPVGCGVVDPNLSAYDNCTPRPS